jgi:steroid 5-alpha reductase family enzyme
MIAKKQIDEYINVLQVQFVLVFIHAIQLYFIDCNYPKWCVWIVSLHVVIFLFMFADFYKQAYKKKQAR